MRRLTLTGNLVKDAEVKTTASNSVIQFTVAVNEKYTDKQGVKQEKAYFFDCALWKNDTNIANYIKKGGKVLVEGTPEINMWKDNNGETKSIIKVRVTYIEFLSTVNNNNTANTQNNQNSQNNQSQANSGLQNNSDFTNQSNHADNDDLPF